LEEVKKSKIKILKKPQFKLWRFKYPLSFYVFIKTLILKPNVMFSFMRRFSIIAVIMKKIFWWRNIKVVISYDNVASLLIPTYEKGRFNYSIIKTLVSLFFSRADVVVVPSVTAKDDMIKNFSVFPGKIIVNKNWVIKTGKQKIRPKYDLVYTGRLDPVKNLKFLIEIVEILAKEIPNLKVCLVGAGSDEYKLKQLVKKKSLLGIIEITGSQKDVYKYLINSKIFVLTSELEGLPISALEAMSCGLPVITTNYPGANELVSNGVNGFICKDKSEYINRVIEVLTNENKRKEIGEQARKFVKFYHSKRKLKEFAYLAID
jgi:glycosyltransferase involved in cell wall biosynthesis